MVTFENIKSIDCFLFKTPFSVIHPWLTTAALLAPPALGPPGRQGTARAARGPAPLGRAGAAAARRARPFPVCCGAQSLCGAGPGLRDRTVPGTMVGTGTGGVGGIASVVPRSPRRAVRTDGARLSRARGGRPAPAWQWLPF